MKSYNYKLKFIPHFNFYSILGIILNLNLIVWYKILKDGLNTISYFLN